MKLNVRENIAEPDNYRFVVATENEIIEALAAVHPILSRVHRAKWLSSLRAGTWAAKEWVKAIRACPELLTGLRQSSCHNVVPSVLRNSLATLVSGTTVTPTFKANYFALGTGATAPANSDTQLETETLRSTFTERSAYLNVAYLDVFFSSATVGGNTYLESGIFVDASATANSGYLLSRVAQNLTLGAAQSLTVNCSITIS